MARRLVAMGLALTALSGLIVLESCEAVFPTRVAPPDAAVTATDAPRSPSLDAGGGGADGSRPPMPDDAACNPWTIPSPPSQVTAAGDIGLVVAVRSLPDLTGTLDASLGFDLDGVCTCPGPPSCKSSMMHCDGPGGRDTTGDELLGLIDEFQLTTPYGDYNERIGEGRFSFLISVAAYNGEADDSNVVVGVYGSAGLLGDGGAFLSPKWDGTDQWSVDDTSILSAKELDGGAWADLPLYAAVNGYVTGGTLVAPLGDVAISIGFAPLRVSGAAIVATLAKDPTGLYTLDGQFTGRISVPSIFQMISVLAPPGDTGAERLCGNQPVFLQLKSEICGLADIMSQPLLDNTSGTCDALSVTLAFTALQAELGPPTTIFYGVPGCDGGIASCIDAGP